MGIFDSLNFFKRKPKEEDIETTGYSSLGLSKPTYGPATSPPPLGESPGMMQAASLPRSPISSEFAAQENMKAKIDLMMTQVDSIRIQNDSINERIMQLERIMRQILELAKRNQPY